MIFVPQILRDFNNVNYKLITNKDGKYSWRPFQLIHPALYVNLVNNITYDKIGNLSLKDLSPLD